MVYSLLDVRVHDSLLDGRVHDSPLGGRPKGSKVLGAKGTTLHYCKPVTLLNTRIDIIYFL